MELRDRNEEHKNLIKDRLDPDFGLLDELLVSRSLTRPEISKVKAIPDLYGRSEAILGYVLDRNISKVKADPESCGRSEEVLGYVLDRNISKVKADPESCGRSEEVLGYVLDRSIYDNFLYALRSTQQTHLANFIFSSGERRAEFGNDWPLTEREISILDTNQRSLVDLLETSDLLPHLFSHNVINNRQRDFVKSKATSHEKNDALLDILRRTSLHNYYETINCLHLTKQSHIAKVLKEGGAVVRVRSELETESDVNQVEDELITTITELLEDRSLGDSARILECSQLRLIAAKRGSSIILYFVCKSLPDLVHLKEMQTSGKLTTVVREMFNEILSRTQVINLRITVYDEDFSRCEFFLCGIGGKDRFKESCDEDDAIATSKTAVMLLSTNTTQYSNRRSLSSNTSREGDYLLPVSHRLPRDANDTVKRTPPLPPPKSGPQMTKDTSGSSSSSTSGSEWHCSECTYWNSSKQYLCEMCDNPIKFDADQCREYSRVRDFQSKDESSCPECRSVAASKSLDCSKCRRLGPKAAGWKDGRTETCSKSGYCEEYGRVGGNRIQNKCKACRISAAIKSNSLDSAQHKRLDEARDDECVKCIAAMAILAPEKPSPKTPKNTTAQSASSFPDSRSPVSVNVGSWRCRKCALLNPANAFYCEVCCWVRDDAWQCQVCNAMISMDMERCQVCDVWRCRLCTTQNDDRENETRVCKMCSQFQ